MFDPLAWGKVVIGVTGDRAVERYMDARAIPGLLGLPLDRRANRS